MRSHPRLARLLPLLSFFVALLLCAGLIVVSIRNRSALETARMEQVILEKSLKVSEVISKLIYKTQVLSALVVKNTGEAEDFEKVAEAIVDDPAILNVLIAPDGVVSEAYPEGEGTQNLIGFDFFSDRAGNVEARRAVEQDQLYFSGPFLGAQGREVLSGRLPVWREAPDGTRSFWGIVAVTLKYPEVLEGAGLDGLEMQGFAYEIWRENPDDGQRQVIARSSYEYNHAARYIEMPMELFNAQWFFRISPVRQWHQYPDNWIMILAGLLVSVLIAFVVHNNVALTQVKSALEQQESIARQAARDAHEASRMKSTFLATISHEIRTPLNSIVGFSELAAGSDALPGGTRDYIGKIHQSAVGLSQIVDDVLDLSKIESGRVELEAIPFSVAEVARACLDISGTGNATLALKAELDPSLPATVTGDPTRLRQVLLNLLSNAVKFTHAGSVTLSCRVVGQGGGAATLLFAVADTGIGMDAEQLRRVMEPYTQADSSTTRRYGGTGLGLSIARDLIGLMGGMLEAESAPGQGSRFSFRLTLPVGQAGATGRQPTPLFAGARVLVCDDVPMGRELMEEHLSRLGIEASTAENGRLAVEAAGRQLAAGQPFDLIFMDVYMPEMDGLEATSRLARLGNTAPVVALTANAVSVDIARYRQAGMADHLAKPVTTAALCACLLRHLVPTGWREDGPATPAPDLVFENGSIDSAAGLATVDGDARRYRALLRRFARDNATAADALEAAIESGNPPQARRLAHSLKGMARMIGATRLWELARDAEAAIATGGTPPGDVLRMLRHQLDTVLADIAGALGEEEG